MGAGIMVCGLNGSGKSTLGKALAEKLGFHFIDNEDLFFPKTNPNYRYAAPRTREAAERLLAEEVKIHENFVFAAVRGDYGAELLPLYQYVVLIEAPKELRLQRIKNRSFQRFGTRILPGGDLYEMENAFFEMVSTRTEQYVEEWGRSLDCPVIRADGTKLAEEILLSVMAQMKI